MLLKHPQDSNNARCSGSRCLKSSLNLAWAVLDGADSVRWNSSQTPAFDRRLDVRPRLQDVAQSLDPAPPENGPTTVMVYRGGHDEYPASAKCTAVQKVFFSFFHTEPRVFTAPPHPLHLHGANENETSS